MVKISSIMKQREKAGLTPVPVYTPVATSTTQRASQQAKDPNAPVNKAVTPLKADPFITTKRAATANLQRQVTQSQVTRETALDKAAKKALADMQTYKDDPEYNKPKYETGKDDAGNPVYSTELDILGNSAESLRKQAERVRSGRVTQYDVDFENASFESFKDSVKSKAQDANYQKEQLAKMGLATDGTDPFADLRGQNFQKYIEQNSYAGDLHYEQSVDRWNKMLAYDKLKKGEYISPEDQKQLDDMEDSKKQVLGLFSTSNENDLTKQGAANATEAMTTTDNGKIAKSGVTSPTRGIIEAMIAKSDPLSASLLQQSLGILDQRMANVRASATEDVDLADQEYSEFKNVVGDMLTRRQGMSELQLSMAKQNMAEEEGLANLTKERELAENETARQITAIKLNDEKRTLQRQNKERMDARAMRIAVAGGFGSGALLDKMSALDAEGDREVANFENMIQLTDKTYLDRALTINEGYARAVTDIHKNYSDKLYDIVEKYVQKVDDVQNAMLGAGQRRYDAYKKAKDKMRDDWSTLQEKSLELQQNTLKEVRSRQDALEKERRSDLKAKWDDTMTYVEKFGTQDREFLLQREKELGLTPGALSSIKTLEELRMLKTQSGAGGATGGTQQWLQKTTDDLLRQYPNDSSREILMKAAYLAGQYYAGTSKASVNARNAVFDTIGEELGEMVTLPGVKNEIDQIKAQSTIRDRVLNIADDPESELNTIYEELTTGTKAPFKGNEDGASQFIVSLFQGGSAAGGSYPSVEPVSSWWNVGSMNPIAVLPGFTTHKFDYAAINGK